MEKSPGDPTHPPPLVSLPSWAPPPVWSKDWALPRFQILRGHELPKMIVFHATERSVACYAPVPTGVELNIGSGWYVLIRAPTEIYSC